MNLIYSYQLTTKGQRTQRFPYVYKLFSKMGASSYLSRGFIQKRRQDKGFGGVRSLGHEFIIREV